MASYDGIHQDLSDNVELIELGEMEDDAEVISEAETALATLKAKAAQKELEAFGLYDRFTWSVIDYEMGKVGLVSDRA